MNGKIMYDCHYVEGVTKAWQKNGFQVYEPTKRLDILDKSNLSEELKKYSRRYQFDYVFSFDFYPAIAEECFEQNFKYISWVLDCPHVSLWSKAAAHETNYIFVFDLEQYKELVKRGLNNVWYLPICADIESFHKCISNSDESTRMKYDAEISFVGNLYSDEDHSLYDQIRYMHPYLQGYMDALIAAQRKIWGADLLGEAINDRIWKLLKESVKWNLGDEYEDSAYEMMLKNMIGQKITQLERKEACSYLARNFEFALYSDSDTSYDPVVNDKNHGHADYLTEMPLIFHYSKINLHITLRSITSGMSLRVLDVLACGGFLLTNFQPEIAEYFIDGEEVVMYYSFEDMYDKIRYYLEHEDERKRIAHAGYLKVKEQFNYMRGIEAIVQSIEGKEND